VDRSAARQVASLNVLEVLGFPGLTVCWRTRPLRTSWHPRSAQRPPIPWGWSNDWV